MPMAGLPGAQRVAKASHSRQQPAETDPRLIGQAHSQSAMEALGLVTPLPLQKRCLYARCPLSHSR